MDLLLPFSVRAEDRVKRFTKDVEKAAIFCLAELDRNKGGLIRKKPPEKILFVAEACYPIWLVPWGNVTLLFDGIGLRKHTVPFDILPDMNVFLREIKANAKSTDAYLDFLSHNINYFQSFAGKGKKIVRGLIADPSFVKDFGSFLSKAKRVNGPISGKVVLTPFMDKAAVESSVAGLSELRNDLENDLRELNYIVKVLIKMTDEHIKNLTRQNEKIRQRSEKEVSRFKSQAFRKTERMRKRYEKKILHVQKGAEAQIKQLQQPREDLEKRKMQLVEYVKNCEAELSSSEEKKDESSLESWKLELKKSRGELSEIEKNLSKIESDVQNVKRERDVQISQLEAEFDAKSKALMSGLEKIINARDTKIALNEEKIKALKDYTSAFIGSISKIVDMRRSAIADLEKFGLQKPRRKYAVAYVPFFLACYEQEFKRRYSLFPPSFVHGMSRVAKIKGVLKGSKITVILDDRSEPITNFLNLFLQLVKQNPIFEEKLVKAACKVNIVGTEESRQEVEKGLERLMDEGWLSAGERRFFKKQLAKT